MSKTTWPNFKGTAQDGCLAIIKAEKLLDAEFQIGRTKVFIRNPLTLFRLEEDRNAAKHRLASLIRARFLAYWHRKNYKKMRAAAIKMEAVVRGHQVRARGGGRKPTRGKALMGPCEARLLGPPAWGTRARHRPRKRTSG